MSQPNDDQYRAWSEGNDQTRAFDGYGAAQNYPQNSGYGYAGPEGQGGGYYEPGGGRDYPPSDAVERPRAQRSTASLTELFNLKSLWIELFIVAIVAGVLYGMIVWVFDLLAVRFSNAVSGEYLALGDPFEYTIRGVGLGILVLVAGAVMMGLHAAVNQPAQLFNLLFVVVGLWALILLLTMALWQSIPEVILLLIGASIIWGVVPMRVGAYRTGVPRLR